MQKIAFGFLFSFPALLSAQLFQLAPPQIFVDSVFFKKQATIRLEFDLDSAIVHYTTTGGYPSDNAPVYEHALNLTTSTTVRAKARHPEFIHSPMVEKQVWKILFSPDSFNLSPQPDSLYPATGAVALFDLKKGGRNLKDGHWLGFRQDTIVFEACFSTPIKCKILMLSTLIDVGSWVFPPARIEVFGNSAGEKTQLLGVWNGPESKDLRDRPAEYDLYQKVLLRPVAADCLQIRVVPYRLLPDWHPGAGQRPWLFIDEIVFQ